MRFDCCKLTTDGDCLSEAHLAVPLVDRSEAGTTTKRMYILKSDGRTFSFSTIRLIWLAVAVSIMLPVCGVVLQAQWIADPGVDKLLQTSIDQVYNLEFDKAEGTLAEVVRLRPDHPAGFFFQAMVQWWRILCNYDDASQDDLFFRKLEIVIDMCDKRLDKNPDDITALFFKGGSVGFRGRLRANRGNWIGAANDGVVALPLVQKAYTLDPNNADVLLGMGIYNYYAEVIPDRYPIVKPLMIFFPSGDRKKGLAQLELATKNANYARVEAKYFLMQNYYLYEKNFARALEIARSLHASYPRNPLFHRYLGRTLVTNGLMDEANAVFTEIEELYVKKQTGYDLYDGREAYYYLGRYQFFAGRYPQALEYFYKSDELSRKLDKEGPSGFMSLANLQVGMIYDLQGKREHALQQYRKVLAMKEYENSHRDAKKYTEKPYGK